MRGEVNGLFVFSALFRIFDYSLPSKEPTKVSNAEPVISVFLFLRFDVIQKSELIQSGLF